MTTNIRAKFRFAMEQPTEETCCLAFDLFDRYGRLKPEFKGHPVKKGSGIWNTELDDGDIFLIESLRIDRQYRRLGQGSTLVRAMLEKVTDKTLGFVTIVRPDILRSEVPCEPSGEEMPNKESSELAARDISKSF
jgi:GNAT superfamily N-acetyltransferase